MSSPMGRCRGGPPGAGGAAGGGAPPEKGGLGGHFPGLRPQLGNQGGEKEGKPPLNPNAPANPAPERGGQPIRSLQYMLNQLAIHNDILTRLAVDGIFGERTLEAVMVFQRENGLPVTGVVDLTTWNAIRDAYIHMN